MRKCLPLLFVVQLLFRYNCFFYSFSSASRSKKYSSQAHNNYWRRSWSPLWNKISRPIGLTPWYLEGQKSGFDTAEALLEGSNDTLTTFTSLLSRQMIENIFRVNPAIRPAQRKRIVVEGIILIVQYKYPFPKSNTFSRKHNILLT